MSTQDIAQRVAQVHLEKTAGTQASARIGTMRFGRLQEQEMWLSVRVPGTSDYISWNTLENANMDLATALEKLKHALKKHSIKVGHVGQRFLIKGHHLEVALALEQTQEDPTPIHKKVQEALSAARIKENR